MSAPNDTRNSLAARSDDISPVSSGAAYEEDDENASSGNDEESSSSSCAVAEENPASPPLRPADRDGEGQEHSDDEPIEPEVEAPQYESHDNPILTIIVPSSAVVGDHQPEKSESNNEHPVPLPLTVETALDSSLQATTSQLGSPVDQLATTLTLPNISKKAHLRIERFISFLSRDPRGNYDVHSVVRALIGAGIDRTLVTAAFPQVTKDDSTDQNPLISPGSMSTGSHPTTRRKTAQVRFGNVESLTLTQLQVVLSQHFAEVIENLPYFDRLMHKSYAEDAHAVDAARIMIESRIDELKKKSSTGETQIRLLFSFLHSLTIVASFCIILVFNGAYFVREPIAVYCLMLGFHIVWLIDLVWNLYLPAKNDNDVVVHSVKEVIWIKRHSLSVDAFALLPVDLILYWFTRDDANAVGYPFESSMTRAHQAFFVFRYLKLVKVVRLSSLFAYVTLDMITPQFVTVFFLLRPILNIVSVCVVAVTAIACLCTLVLRDTFDSPPDAPFLDELINVVSMLSGSGPNVSFSNPQGTVVELLLLACGLIAQAAVISNLSVTVFRNDVIAVNIEQMRETLGILEHFRVPMDVGTEILSYQLHALNDDVSRRMGSLETLPVSMQKEVMLYVRVASVSTVKLFSKATHECKMKIAESLVQAVIPPSTDIIGIGDIGEEMYLIAHGYATVIIFNGATVAMLSRGDYFGEVALLLPNNVRQATVRALTYCDLWVLDKKAFLDILHEFPSLLDAMEDDLKLKGINIKELEISKLIHLTTGDGGRVRHVQASAAVPIPSRTGSPAHSPTHSAMGSVLRHSAATDPPSSGMRSPPNAALSQSTALVNPVETRKPSMRVVAGSARSPVAGKRSKNRTRKLSQNDPRVMDMLGTPIPLLGEAVTVLTRSETGATIRHSIGRRASNLQEASVTSNQGGGPNKRRSQTRRPSNLPAPKIQIEGRGSLSEGSSDGNSRCAAGDDLLQPSGSSAQWAPLVVAKSMPTVASEGFERTVIDDIFKQSTKSNKAGAQESNALPTSPQNRSSRALQLGSFCATATSFEVPPPSHSSSGDYAGASSAPAMFIPTTPMSDVAAPQESDSPVLSLLRGRDETIAALREQLQEAVDTIHKLIDAGLV